MHGNNMKIAIQRKIKRKEFNDDYMTDPEGSLNDDVLM
jgi:hypothetical protein